MQANRRNVLGGLAAMGAAGFALPALAQNIRVDNTAALNGVSQAVVGAFTVAFLTSRNDRAHAGGGLLGSASGGRSSARTALEGVSDADFRHATDRLYEDFVAQLQTAGFQLGDRAALLEAVRRMNGTPFDSGGQYEVILGRNSNADSRVFSPSALDGVWVPREAMNLINLPRFQAGRSGVGFAMAAQTYARQTQTAVVNAVYVIDFAQADALGGYFAHRSSVQVQAGLALTPEASRVFAYAPNGRVATAMVREPIAVGGDFGVFADATSGGMRATEAAVNALTLLTSGYSNSTRRYVMTADAPRWAEGVDELGRVANGRLIGALRGR